MPDNKTKTDKQPCRRKRGLHSLNKDITANQIQEPNSAVRPGSGGRLANVGTPTPEGNWGPDLVTATQNAIRKLLSRNNAKCELRAAKIAALQIAQDL